MTSYAGALRHLTLAAAALFVIAGQAGAAPGASDFGLSIGQSAAGLPDRLWAEDLGYLGASACNANLAMQSGCVAGQEVLVFQPVMPGRAGRVFVTVTAGRVAAIASDLHYVAFSDG